MQMRFLINTEAAWFEHFCQNQAPLSFASWLEYGEIFTNHQPWTYRLQPSCNQVMFTFLTPQSKVGRKYMKLIYGVLGHSLFCLLTH